MMQLQNKFQPAEHPVVGVAGLGLIGGSLCRALKRTGFQVLGFDIDPAAVDAALESGAVDEGSTSPLLFQKADYLFVALYPQDIVPFVKGVAGQLKPVAVVIDCCGVKTPICDELFPFAQGKGFFFLGGHPMAGTEKSGFTSSSAVLFDGASFLLVPGEVPEEVAEAVEKLLLKCGFGRVVKTTAQRHDRLIAYTSQLPHALACAYVLSPSCPQHSGFSSGSYRDVSRVAHLDPDMWCNLFLENAPSLCEELDELMKNLSDIRSAVAAQDAPTLRALLAQARRAKDSAM